MLAGSLMCLVAASLFATLGVLSRFAYDLGLTPYGFVTWRSGVAALAVLALVLVGVSRGTRLVGWRSLAPRDRAALGVAALAGASLDVTMFLAFERVSVAIVLLCFYLFPAMVAAASALLGWERMDRTRAAALLLALGGMVAVVVGGPDTGVAGGIDLVGVALAVGSAISQTVFVLVARRGYRQMPTEQATTVVLLGSAGVATLLAVSGGALDAVWVPFSSPSLLGVMLFAGIFGAGIPSFLFLAAVRKIGGVRTGILMLAQAPIGVALAAVFLDETIGPIQILGGLAILAAAAVIQRSPSRVTEAAAEPVPA